MAVPAAGSACTQAWNSLRGRETVALARELLGGNGVVTDFLVAKMFCDMEAIYTYAARCVCPPWLALSAAPQWRCEVQPRLPAVPLPTGRLQLPG